MIWSLICAKYIFTRIVRRCYNKHYNVREEKINGKDEARLECVKAYQKKYGDLNIPAKYKTDEGFWLGRWWYLQKKLLREETGKLKPEQVEKLKEVLIGGAGKVVLPESA